MFGDDPGSNSGGLSPSTLQTDIGGGGLALGAIGLAGSIFEGMQASKLSQDEASLSQANAYDEERITNLHQQQMHLFNNRQNMENLRNVQKAQAQTRAAGIASGSQYGSGVQGSLSAESAMGGRNAMQLGQDLSVGDQIFAQTKDIDQNKIQMANIQGQMASAQGLQSIFGGASSFGGDLMKAAGPLSMMLGA